MFPQYICDTSSPSMKQYLIIPFLSGIGFPSSSIHHSMNRATHESGSGLHVPMNLFLMWNAFRLHESRYLNFKKSMCVISSTPMYAYCFPWNLILKSSIDPAWYANLSHPPAWKFHVMSFFERLYSPKSV